MTGPVPTEGYIYLIVNSAWPGHVKVGSTRDPQNRLRTYQTHSPHRDYRLVLLKKFPNRLTAERAFRQQLRGRQVGRTEWFNIHPDDAIRLLQEFYERNEHESVRQDHDGD